MANKAKANGPRLVPLKDQAAAAIYAADAKMVAETRPYSIRRRLVNNKIAKAWSEYRAGNYAQAAKTASTAHI